MIKRLLLLFIFITAIPLMTFAQAEWSTEYTINWTLQNNKYCISGGIQSSDCELTIKDDFPVLDKKSYEVIIKDFSIYKSIKLSQISISNLSTSPKVSTSINEGKLHLTISPVIKSINGKVQLLSDLKILIKEVEENSTENPVSHRDFKNKSALSSGTFYKIGIKKSGPVKLTKSFFTDNDIDIDNPENIQIWGQGSGSLPAAVSAERIDDLEQIPIMQSGLGDGSFDNNDFIIFYGQAAMRESIDNSFLELTNSPYSFSNYYFITTGATKAETVPSVSNEITGNELNINAVNVPIHYEKDETNLLELQAGNSGGGEDWYGDFFSPGNSIDYSYLLDGYDLHADKPLRLEAKVAARSSSTSEFRLRINNNTVSQTFSRVQLNENDATFARVRLISNTYNSTTENTIELKFNGNNSAKGWLDFLRVNAYCNFSVHDQPLLFTLPEALNNQKINLTSSDNSINNDDIHLWRIKDELDITEISPTQAQSSSFVIDSASVQDKYILFDQNNTPADVEFIGQIEPQNLHSIDYADMLIITSDEFVEAANRLAEFREHFNDFTVKVVNVNDIYNEFSSGRMSPIGIRDFIKMVYDRTDLKHVLLFGDASFDYRNILSKYPDHNFVPTYQTSTSNYYQNSFGYDDFYALLEDDEGEDFYGTLDVATGRIPAKNLEEAHGVVDKIFRYENENITLGDWRLRSVFLADDNGTDFMESSSRMADKLREYINQFNPVKILFDAYVQESFADGDRYPEATKALNNSIFSGALIVNYIGHGGPTGWSQERVLTIEDIKQWSNKNKLPLFITATCTFSPFENPAATSGGELLLLKQNGGSIALYSTTRPVYNTDNKALTREVFKLIDKASEEENIGIGEILRVAKNNRGNSRIENTRKFLLLGDPALKLAIPKFRVKATKINGVNIDNFGDTLSALEKVTVEGEVQNQEGNRLSSFNGILTPSLYDKALNRKTLGQEGNNVVEFSQQENILFKGKSSIENGKFKFSFIIPKDIDYSIGEGRLSLYAYSPENNIDAMGVADSLTIGSISDESITDESPPNINLYLNDTTFVNGDKTNPDPLLLAHLSDDETGINVAGQSIGHDLVAYLDDDITTSIVLNSFYSAELDNPKEGNVEYLLNNIEPGSHTLTLEAWDLANNKASETINFHVTENDEIVVMDVTAGPNPFQNSTTIRVKHNLHGKNLKVKIPIFNTFGEKITTIEQEYDNAPATLTDLRIDTETFPTMLPNTYFYRVILEHTTIKGEKIRLVSNDHSVICVR